MAYHKSVLLKESVDGLNIKPDGIYVDATFGGGGHSNEILKRLSGGKLFAFDQDEEANKNKISDERLILINANFRFIGNFLKFYKIEKADGIIADLGISSKQIDTPKRGFSTRFDGNLDMRMDVKSSETAADVLRNYDKTQLIVLFKEYGELSNAVKIADAICRARNAKAINSISDLKHVLLPLSERGKENKFFAKVFQALRIEVNNEIEVLKEFLTQTPELLSKGGRMVVISYHSLEDRLVKNFFKAGNLEGDIKKDFFGNEVRSFKMINKKPIVPNQEEININSRARSAKLRIAEKI